MRRRTRGYADHGNYEMRAGGIGGSAARSNASRMFFLFMEDDQEHRVGEAD